MTGSGVERFQRTAFLPSSVPSAGVSALMPPHSQGAERRREHRPGRTGSRWALRTLVIGGLAGAAWLLTGAAAHAADRDPAGEGLSLGSSLIGSVVHGDDRSGPVVNRVLKAATTPLDPGHRGLGSAVALPNMVVGTLHEATHSKVTHSKSDADSALGGVDGVVRELTAPLRPAGEAVDTRKLAPVTELPQDEVLVDDVAAPEEPAKQAVAQVDDTRAAVADETVADQVSSAVVRDEELPAAEPVLDRRNTVGKTVTRQHSLAADRHRAAVVEAEPVMVSDTPGGDAPAPLRVHLGAANGVPASGPGTATDGGSAAFLPAKVADSTVAFHRLPIATDVEVRRHDAEAPTVSPD
ncbi:Polycystic kidney disease protein 1-like 3 [Actinoplanes friuliensis DSM 7358]|jgi:hypothetical protein|uniref:Polycystic kidney disease protein 1-like 3 n=2 Tax=Actinoplanes friuliensis TaxID=196914 RepID=U5VRH0_9ACTN|nr:Polycystic kidney disease protein 1-like 3 [Actinoplanes friuliensis DSM 7358]